MHSRNRKKFLDLRNVSQIESKRFGNLIGCEDQLERGIKVTPKFLALGGGTFTQGRSRLEGDTVTSVSDRIASEIQIRYPGSLIHGQSQPLAHCLSFCYYAYYHL